MGDAERLEWQFEVARMGRDELEALVRSMDEEDERPLTMDEIVGQATRSAAIHNGEAVLRRGTAAPERRPGGGRARTATVDLSAYYAAVDASEEEARAEADRAEVRAMCERRLAHFRRRDELGYDPVPSPLRAYIDGCCGRFESVRTTTGEDCEISASFS